MKKLLPFFLLAAACGKNVPPVQHASPDQCVQLYDHLLDLSAAENMPHDMPADQVMQAKQLISQELQQNGSAMRFFLYCTNGMTRKQFDCAVEAPSLSSINQCHFIKE